MIRHIHSYTGEILFTWQVQLSNQSDDQEIDQSEVEYDVIDLNREELEE